MPAYLLYALIGTPGVFLPAGSDLAKAESDIVALREQLKAACVEPVQDLVEKKQHAIFRRVERIAKGIVAEWTDQSALSVMLMLWYFVKDLTDWEILILWEGSTMARATSGLLPMFAYGFDEQDRDAAAQEQARHLLDRLRKEGLYS
ncbi:hypothetical protein [Methylobacterium gossipiicola]|uniref:Uncharacterized protein n=1 Tax=Methylobacterium gossipiicola TaxID=582675 RepID=A0A1I2XPW5_9HYPH|nr:hypothetical protein [Methylobacterium gossipiicola]SFH15079.1 hypothetical protein SAMN05192565_1565 [Methylobacterium gossipiicola]